MEGSAQADRVWEAATMSAAGSVVEGRSVVPWGRAQGWAAAKGSPSEPFLQSSCESCSARRWSSSPPKSTRRRTQVKQIDTFGTYQNGLWFQASPPPWGLACGPAVGNLRVYTRA